MEFGFRDLQTVCSQVLNKVDPGETLKRPSAIFPAARPRSGGCLWPALPWQDYRAGPRSVRMIGSFHNRGHHPSQAQCRRKPGYAPVWVAGGAAWRFWSEFACLRVAGRRQRKYPFPSSHRRDGNFCRTFPDPRVKPPASLAVPPAVCRLLQSRTANETRWSAVRHPAGNI